MNNNRERSTHPEKTDLKKLAGLQQLKLEQLEGIVGGIAGIRGTKSQDQTEVV